MALIYMQCGQNATGYSSPAIVQEMDDSSYDKIVEKSLRKLIVAKTVAKKRRSQNTAAM